MFPCPSLLLANSLSIYQAQSTSLRFREVCVFNSKKVEGVLKEGSEIKFYIHSQPNKITRPYNVIREFLANQEILRHNRLSLHIGNSVEHIIKCAIVAQGLRYIGYLSELNKTGHTPRKPEDAQGIGNLACI